MGLKRTLKRKRIEPETLGSLVIVTVITPLDLDTEGQEFVNGELEWLFSAAEHLTKINRSEIDRNQPITQPIPPDAEKHPQANNKLLDRVDDFDLQIWEGQVASGLTRINTHLRNLNILLDQEGKQGLAGKGNVYLQNQINGACTEIVRVLQEMAELMSQAYGIRITSPDQLIELLEV